MSRQSNSPVFQLVSKLDPGTSVDRVFINGRRESVDTFISFNQSTGLVTFGKSNGEVLLVDYRRIDAIRFG